MGKKMKLFSLFNNKERTHYQWQWPSCKQPKTLSFRAEHNMFKNIRSFFCSSSSDLRHEVIVHGPALEPTSYISLSDLSHEPTLYSKSLDFEVELNEEITFDKLKPDSEIETIVCRARSDRLFFERAGLTQAQFLRRQKMAAICHSRRMWWWAWRVRSLIWTSRGPWRRVIMD